MSRGAFQISEDALGELVTILISFAGGGLVMALVAWRGHTIRINKLSLPFLEADLTRFASLSAVKFFNEVSARLLTPSETQAEQTALETVTASPLLLIHAGWNLVCETFVERFAAYPDDEHILAVAAEIGGQSVEFTRMYRDIHLNAIRHASQVTPEFAANYLLRAPSLAERIEGGIVFLGPEISEHIKLASKITRTAGAV